MEKEQTIYGGDDEFLSTCRLLDDLKPEDTSDRFFCFIDPLKKYKTNGLSASNMCLDYSILLDHSLEELLDEFATFENRYLALKKSLFSYIDRCIHSCQSEEKSESIKGLKNRKANGFFDALQRILFINSLQWQFGHHLVGLGRLDQWLLPYYQKERRQENKECVLAFLSGLHRYYRIKSNELLGDTGQIVILGGTSLEGEDRSNEVTELFLEALEELHLPDPKLMLRYSSKTDDFLMSKAAKLIESGVGSPIMANDERIIPALMRSGYSKPEAYDYAVSACWEPFSCGNSVSRNNLYDLNYAESLNVAVEKMLSSGKKGIDSLYSCLEEVFKEKLSPLRSGPWDEEPIESLFIRHCREKRATIGQGGADHYDVGFLTTGLSNCVNGLLAIERLCYKEKKLTLSKFNEIRKNNFADFDTETLKDPDGGFGSRSKDAIKITNKVLKLTNDVVLSCQVGKREERLYFGLSSSNYLAYGSKLPATFDGRKANTAYGVHVSNEHVSSPLEVLYFFRNLDLPSRCVNGNVVDTFFDQSLFQKHPSASLQYLRGCCQSGVYELQMNVTSYETLLDAKLHPENHTDLIVRVWGFSSYFNDLPIEYKDLLIERARASRGQSL